LYTPAGKPPEPEIRRKANPRRKCKVETLYQWACEVFALRDMMKHQFPFRHLNIEGSKDMPVTFVLVNPWSIPDDDLKTLTHGPLRNEAGKLLVHEGGRFSYHWRTWGRKVVVVVGVLGSLASIIMFMVWLLTKV
jgi:hypothetical protein